jgi:hypothetical protein
MPYRFVQAYYDYGARVGPTLAFVIHMAEGGGTVGYLSHQTPRGVSVHYVVEYDGEIVQMLRENRVSGSINPNDLRTSDGPSPYGASVARAVLGTWYRNPNQAVITVEVEGFAKDGPNAAQRAALKRLISDVRSRYPKIGLLGHRDFQDYKACPGGKIPWADLGGHGPSDATEESDMRPFPVGLDPRLVTIRPGAQLLNLDLSTQDAPTFSGGSPKPSRYTYRTGNVTYRVVEVATGGAVHLWLLKPSDVLDMDPLPVPTPTPVTAIPLAPGIYQVE